MRLWKIPALAAMVVLAVTHAAAADATAPSRKIVATYFFTNVRCSSCLTIERLTGETIKGDFAGPIGEGRLQWRSVNIDEPGNFHYVKDYKLYSKSVILSEVVDGREVRWKNLEKVWTLLRDEAAFRQYVHAEVASFLAEN